MTRFPSLSHLRSCMIFLLCAISAVSNLAADQESDPGEFHFVVMADRTGGMRPGVFGDALKQVNQMQPDFVICVGDLIDGYTENPAVWNAQWDEFESLVTVLEMPFYHVPGNHDISNAQLEAVWRERVGPTYYHFLHEGSLFLVLNTEDDLAHSGITEDQVAYFKKALEENETVDWTYVFMHRPLWAYENQAGYEDIEAMLKGRSYTVFSGHHHTFRYDVRNGARHFILATTGGGSALRGPQLGEFDHFTWVAAGGGKEPQITHLGLNGILPADIIPPQDFPMTQLLQEGRWLRCLSFVATEQNPGSISPSIKVHNSRDRDLHVSGTFSDPRDIEFSPATLDITLAPGESRDIPVKLTSAGGLDLQALCNQPPGVKLNASFQRSDGRIVNATASGTWMLDWTHELKIVDESPVIDGSLDEWHTEKFIEVRSPQYTMEGWDWRGMDDGLLSFDVRFDGESLYLAALFQDDKILVDTKSPKKRQDKFFVDIDYSGFGNATGKGDQVFCVFEASDEPGEPFITVSPVNNGRIIKAALTIDETQVRHQLELRIRLNEIAGKDSGSVRINIGFMDHDQWDNTKPSVIWWHPKWGAWDDYQDSGKFVIKPGE